MSREMNLDSPMSGLVVRMPLGFQGVVTLNFPEQDLRTTTTDDLKSWVTSLTGQPENAQRLVFAGKVLGDSPILNLSLYSQNVREGSNIHVVNNLGNDDRVLWEFARELMQNSPGISWKEAKTRAATVEEVEVEVEVEEEQEEDNYRPDENRCLCCNIDMGEGNPRQLCGKTECNSEGYWFANDNCEEHVTPGETCPECSKSNIVTDWDSGDTVCTDCGLILSERAFHEME
jgi:hypothetical protein